MNSESRVKTCFSYFVPDDPLNDDGVLLTFLCTKFV